MADFQIFKVFAEGIARFSLGTDFLGLFLMIGLGLIIFRFGLLNKSVNQFLWGFRGGIKVFPLKECFSRGGGSPDPDSVKSEEKKSKSRECKRKIESKGGFVEDDESDVKVLRKMVRKERDRANAACADLEKERMAAASATEEAMTMILRLQSEKSAIEISANQFRRMIEQKQEYDQENIGAWWGKGRRRKKREKKEDEVGPEFVPCQHKTAPKKS